MISDKYAPHRKYCWVKESDVLDCFRKAAGNLEEATRLINLRGYKINKYVLQTRKNQLIKDGVFPKELRGAGRTASVISADDWEDMQKELEEMGVV